MDTTTDLGIVVAIDRSSANAAALRWAAAEALLRNLPLTLVHVLNPIFIDRHDARLRARIRRWREYRGRRLLAETKATVAEITRLDSERVHTELRFGPTLSALNDVSNDASMLVVGSRFHGSVGGRRLRSVSAGLCSSAHCPVVVVHGGGGDLSSRPVIVGIDGSEASERAIAIAFDEASRRRVRLVAVHVWSDVGIFPLLGMDWHVDRDQADEVLGERLAGWQERYPDVVVERRVYCDRPAHWLVEAARQGGLVVVGSHGRGAITSLALGSVATAVAESVDVPVIVARRK